MADDPKQDEPGEGKVLPQRELMSLISTDPTDPMYSALVPPDEPIAAPVDPEGPPDATLPVEPEVE